MRRLLAAITLSLISSSAIATGGTSPAHDQSLIAGQAGDRAEQPDTSPQQLALVIGNSGYRHSPLATPGNDARTMAGLLRIGQAVEAANQALLDTCIARPELNGMGTTMVVAAFRDHRLFYAHVGDSRLYRIRFGRMRRLTHDHSLIQRMVDEGVFLNRSEAREAGDEALRRLGQIAISMHCWRISIAGTSCSC